MYIYKLFGLIVQTDVKLFGNQVFCDVKPEVRMIQGDLQRITDEINNIICIIRYISILFFILFLL